MNCNSYILVLLLLILIIFIILDRNLNRVNKNIENFSLIKNDTFYDFIHNNKYFEVIDTNRAIKYGSEELTGHIGTNINYKIYSKLKNKDYIILRYPDFRSEIKRHSIDNFNNYLNYLKNYYFNQSNNYILDFTGFHGFIDNKVNLWIDIKNKYGRLKADEVMCKTYLCPNDYELFLNEFDNKKYILKNSFGGARSALKITNSKDEIIQYFEDNKKINFNPELCKDSVCHSKVKYNIVQRFMEPGLLIDNRKVGFRLYLVIFSHNKNLKAYLYKNGVCYYSKNEYNQNNTELNNNVVGSIFKMQEYIQSKNLPMYFKDFTEYVKNNNLVDSNKINYFIKKLKEGCEIIVNTVRDRIIHFHESNIEKFSVYGLDVEYDKNFKPCIFEGNFYFTRFKSNNKYGKLINDLYNDIFYKLGLTNENIYGFYDLSV